MLKFVCFALALSGTQLERVPLGTYYDAYSANMAIARALDAHDGPSPDCEEYERVDGEWRQRPRWRSQDVRVISGYEGTRMLLPGEVRIEQRLTVRKRHRRW